MYLTDDPVLENNYKWLDGTPKDFKLWAPNEPNDSGGVEDCVLAFRTGGLAQKWNDLKCETNYKGYVCKAPVGKYRESKAPLGKY